MKFSAISYNISKIANTMISDFLISYSVTLVTNFQIVYGHQHFIQSRQSLNNLKNEENKQEWRTSSLQTKIRVPVYTK
jgi:hypothetical protein